MESIKRCKLFALVLATTVMVTACGGGSESPKDPEAVKTPIAETGSSGGTVPGGGNQAINLELAKNSGCFACHSLDKKVVGPAWIDVANRYRNDSSARDALVAKVKAGGKGNWTEVAGGVPMPPYSPRVSDADIDALVSFILSLSPSQTSTPQPPPSGETKTTPPEQRLPDLPVGTGPELSLDLAKASGCLACHSVEQKVVGPAWDDVAVRYAGVPGARDALVNKVKAGGKGNWTDVTGGVPMPPYSPRVADADIVALVDGILNLKNPSAPKLFDRQPVSGAVNVGLDASVKVTFSEAIDSQSAKDGLTVTDGAGKSISGTTTVSGSDVIFTPTSPLDYGTKYNVAVTTAIKDATGIALKMGVNWSFTTVQAEQVLPDLPAESVFDLSMPLAKASGCLACHSVDKTVVGPAWNDVANRYRGKAGARDALVNKVKAGGKGNWTDVTGGVPMPPYSPRVADADIVALVDGILSLGNPAAPVLSVSGGLKQLHFTWPTGTTGETYRLLSNPDGHSGFNIVVDNITGTSADVDVAVHRLDWTSAAYMLEACNTIGCRRSQAVSVKDKVLAAIGYFKASNTDTGDRFGYAVAVSGDGSTLAVGVPDEDSNATGVNGDESDNTLPNSGAVYIYKKLGAAWQFHSYVKPQYTGAGYEFGFPLALNRDGTILAVGTVGDASAATGINAFINNSSATGSGAVYVFERVGESWTQQAYIKASNANANDVFGFSIALNSDGNVLAVGAPYEQSLATGINGNQSDNSGQHVGATYVFARTVSGWAQQAYIKVSRPDADDYFGYSLSLNQKGDTLAVGAWGESSAATTVNGDASDNSAKSAGAAYIFNHDDAGWHQQAYLKAPNAENRDAFGLALALDGSGDSLAVSAIGEDGANSADPVNNAVSESGAVYIYGRTGGVWAFQSYLKASNANSQDQFGRAVAMSGDGKLLVVGSNYEDSAAVAVGGDELDNSAADSGAAYVFTLKGLDWTQSAYLKAPNADAGDGLGDVSSLAISDDGNTLAIGALREDSAATGIGGNQSDNSSLNAGAVYLY